MDRREDGCCNMMISYSLIWKTKNRIKRFIEKGVVRDGSYESL